VPVHVLTLGLKQWIDVVHSQCAETDAFANQIGHNNFPKAGNWGDVTKVGKQQVDSLLQGDLEYDLVFMDGGFPCKDTTNLEENTGKV
jgi:site-specific DNA-cytosine methylase